MVTILLLCIVLGGIGLWIHGRKKSSRMTGFTGGLGVAAPLLYAAGVGLLLPFAPLLALGAAYWMVESTNNR
ncbi:hypothetical protein SAMN05421781_0485 [Marinococcus luteus]|uniref:Uncharacterized protein n=1 Tax=Marinococcus luteus TaxID=1122204 RepID=A0A1H2QVP0_9BACI|nr:hypothetical protein [Marinococcus luteus]SDW11242.1 hypothetical protein SAMN05421781_0485 [Marinococcus luteus]